MKNEGKRSRPTFLLPALLAAFFLLSAQTLAGQERKPLLIPGKSTLYQRVVTHPGAILYPTSDSALATGKWVHPFSVFYVYQRTLVGEDPWLEVGLSTAGRVDGWLRKEMASDWNQSLSLMFTERTGRQPVLFFKDLDYLERVAGSPAPGDWARQLAEDFEAIRLEEQPMPERFPILAMEPSARAVAMDRFYLIPIFRSVQLFEGVKFLKIASIDPGAGAWAEDGSLKTAIAFVIDTTISMRPYIEQAHRTVRLIYDAIEKAGLADQVAFGLVGYRSNIEKTPELEYVSRVFSDFLDGSRRQELETALAAMQEAGVSSHSFNEDAFAGLKTALENLDWGPYQSRLLFLISDAGPLLNTDPFSTTGLNSAEMADMAAAKGVKVFALHLKTPLGGADQLDNHGYAEREYRLFTGHADSAVGDLYVPIDAATTEKGVQRFGLVVEKVAGQMVELVRLTNEGRRLELPQGAPAPAQGDSVLDAERKARILGYAMQLQFLGRQDSTRAPAVVSAWVSDMDLVQPDRPAFQVTVLLTKNQLSDLYQQLRIILENAQRTKRTGARDFFQSILSAAAQLSRDPIQFSRQPGKNLGQLGVLSEFLDDLPYRSSIMRLSEDDWYRMSVGEQQSLVDGLKSKLNRYKQIYDDVSNWQRFAEEDPGDAVYRVPLSLMP